MNMFIAATVESAVHHLIDCWDEIPKGAVYPGLDGLHNIEAAMGMHDIFIMKMRYRVDGVKYGAAVALDEDVIANPVEIAKEVASQIPIFRGATTVEWTTTTFNPEAWTSFPERTLTADTATTVVRDDTHQY
jgi:hypothetical protein